MKKTIIALLAMSFAYGSADQVLVNVTDVTDANKISAFVNSSTSATLAITLDVAQMKTLGGATGDRTTHRFATLTGTWEDDNEGYMSLGTWGDNGSNGVQAPWKWGSSSGVGHVGMNNCFSETPINWSQVEGMSMVMSISAPEAASEAGNVDCITFIAAISYLYSDGRIETVGAENSDLFHFGSTNNSAQRVQK